MIKDNCVESGGEAKREETGVEYMCLSVYGMRKEGKNKRGYGAKI